MSTFINQRMSHKTQCFQLCFCLALIPPSPDFVGLGQECISHMARYVKVVRNLQSKICSVSSALAAAPFLVTWQAGVEFRILGLLSFVPESGCVGSACSPLPSSHPWPCPTPQGTRGHPNLNVWALAICPRSLLPFSF